jgi:hypothetical protein
MLIGLVEPTIEPRDGTMTTQPRDHLFLVEQLLGATGFLAGKGPVIDVSTKAEVIIATVIAPIVNRR